MSKEQFKKRNWENATWKRLKQTFTNFETNEHDFSDYLHDQKGDHYTVDSWEELRDMYKDWCASNHRAP